MGIMHGSSGQIDPVGGRATTSFRRRYTKLRTCRRDGSNPNLAHWSIIDMTNDALPIKPISQVQGERTFVKRWQYSQLFERGFLAVPSTFLQLYARLQPFRLTTGEALFILHLMEFKWDADAPFPGYATLAERMGISVKMARRHAQTLEGRKYLRREMRTGKTNRFDLSPLFGALLNTLQLDAGKRRTSRRANKDKADALLEWAGKMIQAHSKLSEQDKKSLAEWESMNLDGKSFAAADWPGWEVLIGKKPET